MEKEKLGLDAALMGLVSIISPFSNYDSSPRLAMLYNHIRQAVQVRFPDIPLMLHGYENQLRAYDIRMPDDGIVVSVHHKYKRGLSNGSIKENPLTSIIYQNAHTGEYDCVHIHEYNTNHRTYGSKYILDPIVNKLSKGMQIRKGTIFAHSPAKFIGDIYSTSLTCNVLAISDPVTTEDGFGVSESFCKRAGLLELNKWTGSWGKKRYLLNTYGTIDNFKGYPDVGEAVRDDGVLFAFREYNDNFNALEMTNEALMYVDPDHDIKTHAEPGSIVYDITVESGIGETNNKVILSPSLAKQSEKYINQLSVYYESLLESEAKILKENKEALFSPILAQLLTRAIADKPNNPSNKMAVGGRVRRAYKKEDLDDYRITIKTYNSKKLGIGAKLTNLHGGLTN